MTNYNFVILLKNFLKSFPQLEDKLLPNKEHLCVSRESLQLPYLLCFFLWNFGCGQRTLFESHQHFFLSGKWPGWVELSQALRSSNIILCAKDTKLKSILNCVFLLLFFKVHGQKKKKQFWIFFFLLPAIMQDRRPQLTLRIMAAFYTWSKKCKRAKDGWIWMLDDLLKRNWKMKFFKGKALQKY